MTIKELVYMNMEKFENPDKKPVEELKLRYISDETVDGELIPALDHRWCNKGYVYTLYIPPPSTNVNGEFTMGSKEDWLERIGLFIEDMDMLLHMNYHRFWSEVIYNKHTLDGINSFLQNAAPFFMKDQMPHNKEIFRMFKKVQESVLLILTRLTKPKESEICWMKTTTLANNLYNNFVLSMPQLLEICLVYANDNFNVVEELINRVVKIQPKYLIDVEKSTFFINEVFSKFENHLNRAVDADYDTFIPENCKESFSSLEFVKLVYLLLDISYSLAAFLEVCPQAGIIFHDQQLEPRISNFYGNTIPVINRLLELQFKSEDANKTNLQLKINLSRHQLISSAHRCLTSVLMNLIESREYLAEQEIKARVDSYINTLYECLTDHLFMRDYNSAFPVQKDLRIVAEIWEDIDTLKCEYIVESVMSLYELPQQKAKKETNMGIPDKIENSTNDSNNHVPKPKETISNKVSGVELDSLITEVRDILPHLGDGFVAKCLEYFNFNSADVINLILENNLPEELASIDQDMPLIPAEDKEEKKDGYERINVYDNDEFDIMTQDNIDTSRIHKGKRQIKHKNLSEMLDDKSHVNQLRDMYNQLSLVECLENVNEYEDEYDDSYDDIDVPVGNEGDKEEERRAFVTPRVLQQYKKTVDHDVDYNDEAEEEDKNDKADHFIENPAEIRERADQRRQEMRGRGSGRSRAAFSQRTVIGNPKGQGQDKEVLVNREFKNAHKASRGNHNRRAMAAKKRRQGMFPS